jgi:hypothetical protein
VNEQKGGGVVIPMRDITLPSTAQMERLAQARKGLRRGSQLFKRAAVISFFAFLSMLASLAFRSTEQLTLRFGFITLGFALMALSQYVSYRARNHGKAFQEEILKLLSSFAPRNSANGNRELQ